MCAYRCPGPGPRTTTRCHRGAPCRSSTCRSSEAKPAGPMPPWTTTMLPTAAAECAARGEGPSPEASSLLQTPLRTSKLCTSEVAPARPGGERRRGGAADVNDQIRSRESCSEREKKMRDGWRAGRGRTDAARAPVGPVSFQRGGTSEDDQALPAALGGDACQGVPAARSRIVAPRVDVELSTPQPGRRGRHPRRSPSDETEGAGFLSFPTRCPREQARLRVGSGRQLPRERSVLSPANQAVRMLKKSPAWELISANPQADLSTFPVSSR